MASFTTDYSLNDSDWHQASTDTGTVIITNPKSLPIRYAVAAIDTDLNSVTGHQLNYKETVKLTDLGTGNNVFIKSDNDGGGAEAIVTAY